jgi:RES domain-containing protein
MDEADKENMYEYDRNGVSHKARLCNGAYLYRITSVNHCNMEKALNGGGPLNSAEPGRFHEAQQRASYCANNVLVCIAEVLFQMYRTALKKVDMHSEAAALSDAFHDKRCLVLFRVAEIDNLVNIDADDIVFDYQIRLSRPATVYPDPRYRVISELNRKLREDGKRGVLYPSARHSQDMCVVLFYDETSRIDPTLYEALSLELSLLTESQDLRSSEIQPIDVRRDKIHPTMGYYAFNNVGIEKDKLKNLKDRGLIYPENIPQTGMIDFVRRRYEKYPAKAVCS